MSRLLARPSPSRIKNHENAFIGGLAYALPVVSMCSFYVQYNMSEEIEMKKFRSPFLRSIVMHTLTQTIFDHLAAEDEDEDEDLLT